MYEVEVDYKDSFKYNVRSGNYEVKIDFPQSVRPAEGITPPDLLLASAGSCIAVYLERYLNSAGIKFKGFSINVKSDICKESPRYLKNIDVRINLEADVLEPRRKEALLEFVKNCPVHNTLLYKPEIRISLQSSAFSSQLKADN